MDDNRAPPERVPRALPIGDGLYRSSAVGGANWSDTWPFVERRKPQGPEDTFRSEATPWRQRRSTDRRLPS